MSDIIREWDVDLISKWRPDKELLQSLILNPAFMKYQDMLQDSINNLIKYGLDRNAEDSMKDYNTICEKRGALGAYYEIFDLLKTVLAQIEDIEEAERAEKLKAEAKGENK